MSKCLVYVTEYSWDVMKMLTEEEEVISNSDRTALHGGICSDTWTRSVESQ